jgi:hypothetical protein
MNTKWIAVLTLAVALIAGAIVVAHAQNQPKTASSQGGQLDKIVQQNEKILSGQQEILKAISQLRDDVLILKRRSS